MTRTTKPTLINLALLALDYARAVEDTASRKHALQLAYLKWRRCTGNQWTDIERGSPEWEAMMQATASEYQEQQKAKRRERHAKAKLLAMADKLEGA